MKKRLVITGIIIALAAIAAFFLFFAGVQSAPNITWGIDFSQMRAESLKLDWQATYLAILDDLGAKNIKLHTQWDFVEGTKDAFYFADTDLQLQQAKNHGAEIIYVVGMKTWRWPECHLPGWAAALSKKDQQAELLDYIKTVVLRYKNNAIITAWQAENEPLFKFGQCPWYDANFLKQEVALVKSLDPLRPVIVSDSGEQSLWWQAAGIGDIVGTTLYRVSWVHISNTMGFYFHFPISPFTYWLRTQIVEHIFHKKVINVELQAEPWIPDSSYNALVQHQSKTMNLAQFQKNIQYAEHTGFDIFYLWGAEWWYWMQTVQRQPEMWNAVKATINRP